MLRLIRKSKPIRYGAFLVLMFSVYSVYASKNYYCLKDGSNNANNAYACNYFLFEGWKCDQEEWKGAGDGDCAGNRITPIEKPKEDDRPSIDPGF